MFIDEGVQPLTRPTQISSESSSVNAVMTSNYVVIDEKAFKPGLLFSAISKGMTKLSFPHGKGLNLIRRGDWLVIQVLDAGCGKKVQHQSAPYSSSVAKKNNTEQVKIEGQKKIKQAW